MISVYDELIGKVIVKIDNYVSASDKEDSLIFHLSNGAVYKQYHENDCCENVFVEDINGDLDDLIGSKLIQAEESTKEDPDADESGTWTFYKFGTSKGYVTIRWYGCSNGYYSESADMIKIEDEYPIKEMRKIKLDELDNIKKESN